MKIKGHTSIRLMDAQTGEITTVEESNMVTDALNKFFANAGWMNPSPFISGSSSVISSSLVERFMGGLLLFDTAQEEDVNHLIVTAGTKMVGNGCVGTVSNDSVTELGSWNDDESGWNATNDVYTMVWDFTTSQANGTIACASLTSLVHGYIGEGNSTSHLKKDSNMDDYANSVGGYPKSSPFTFANLFTKDNYIYGFNIDKVTNKLSLVRDRVPITEIDLRDNISVTNPEIVNEDFYTYPVSIAWDVYGSKSGATYSTYFDDEYCWIAIVVTGYMTIRFADDCPIVVLKIKKSDLTYTVTELTPSNTGITDIDGNFSSNIMQDKLLLVKGDGTSSYLIHTDNIANVEDVTNNAIASFTGVVYNSGDRLYDNNKVFDSVLKTIEPTNGATYNPRIYGRVNGNSLLMYSAFGNGLTINRYSGYLATINNLEEPVTKDATKTMKVIYTLTFSEEE